MAVVTDLQVPLDLADVVLEQEVVVEREAAVLVVQLGQQLMEANSSQRTLNRHCIPGKHIMLPTKIHHHRNSLNIQYTRIYHIVQTIHIQ